MWSFIGAQPDFEKAVGVVGDSIHFVAMATRRLMYSNFVGNFSNGVEVQDFIRSVIISIFVLDTVYHNTTSYYI